MRKLALIFGLILAATPAFAQAPVLLSLSQTAATAGGVSFSLYVGGSGFASNSTVDWNGTPLTTTGWSASQTIWLQATVPSGDIASAGTASVTVNTPSVGTSSAITFTINASYPTPTCGIADDGDILGGTNLPAAWGASTPTPAYMGTYIDPESGCKAVRITNSDALGITQVHNYNTQSAIDASDTFIAIGDTNGNVRITDFTGNVIVTTTNFSFARNDTQYVWDHKTGGVFYYANGDSLMKGTVTGYPACAAAHSCMIATATVHTFSEYSGCANGANIMAAPNETPGGWIPMVGQNVCGGAEDIFLYRIADGQKSPVYTTTCTGNVNGVSNACLHKLMGTSNDGIVVQFSNSGTGNELGQHLWEPPLWANPMPQFNDGGSHLDTGLDLAGNIVAIQEGTSTGQPDPCPNGGGSPIDNLSTGFGVTCIMDKNFLAIDVSYDGDSSFPWALISYQGAYHSPGPEFFDNSTFYAAPEWTNLHDGASWKHCQEEFCVARVDANNSYAGPPFKVWRFGYTFGRGNVNMSSGGSVYESQAQASWSYDHKYFVWNSNMAYAHSATGACPFDDPHCSDAYLMEGPGGGPLFSISAGAPVVALSPTSLSFGNQVVSTTSAQQVVTLTNTGTASLTISSVALTTGTQFAFATPGSGSDCRTVGTVAASGTCNIAVTFTPLSAGAQSDTVSITDNASGSPHTFGVSGTGIGSGAAGSILTGGVIITGGVAIH